MALQSVDDVHSGDRLALGVFAVRDSVPNDVLEKELQHASDLFVDHATDSLDTTTTSETADSGLRDSLDVVAKDFAMALSASLSKTFATFSSARHCDSKLISADAIAVEK